MGFWVKWKKDWGRWGEAVVSLFILAAVLPVMLFGALNKDRILLLIGARQEGELRVWLEPAEIVTRVGERVEISVVAETGDARKLLPGLKLKLVGTEGIKLDDMEVSYLLAFSGRTVVGTVGAQVVSEGVWEISIDESSVNTGLPDVPVVTGKARITARK